MDLHSDLADTGKIKLVKMLVQYKSVFFPLLNTAIHYQTLCDVRSLLELPKFHRLSRSARLLETAA